MAARQLGTPNRAALRKSAPEQRKPGHHYERQRSRFPVSFLLCGASFTITARHHDKPTNHPSRHSRTAHRRAIGGTARRRGASFIPIAQSFGTAGFGTARFGTARFGTKPCSSESAQRPNATSHADPSRRANSPSDTESAGNPIASVHPLAEPNPNPASHPNSKGDSWDSQRWLRAEPTQRGTNAFQRFPRQLGLRAAHAQQHRQLPAALQPKQRQIRAAQ